ncbi:benzoate/H(+) symporter BenE family transporter [Amorphus sp. 3PC139-8]|uniref:benzoate/H(+) symporter BenE family transporter n=1 Tax=Amorphus sp. 3PC139-8 TaxID=2735676 RepID=UPI00345D3EF1
MRLFPLEPIRWPPPSLREIARSISAEGVSAALIALILSATGTFAILLTIGREAGLPADLIGSFAAVVYGFGGVTTIVVSLLYRQPLTVLWTITGATLLPAALTHMSFPEAMGACMVAGLGMMALGLSGSMQQVTRLIPLPIALAMLLGVFLPFGTGMVKSVVDLPEVAGPTVLVYLIFAAVPRIARRCPPVFAALVAGLIAVAVFDPVAVGDLPTLHIVDPILVVPEFRLQAILSLAPAMLLTSVAIHNAQSIAILKSRGFEPPVNGLVTALGAHSLVTALFGGVPAAIATVHTALFSAAGEMDRRYANAVVFGVFAIVLGLCAPMVAKLALVLPNGFTVTLAGLALLGVLEESLTQAFSGPHRFPALVTLLVSASGIAPFGLAAPFWALVAGVSLVWLIDRPKKEA